MISYEMIAEAYQNHLIHLEPSKTIDGVRCRIGQLTLPFGGVAAMNVKNITELHQILTEDEIVGAIFDTLDNFLEDSEDDRLDDYRYCECFLRSNGIGMEQSKVIFR